MSELIKRYREQYKNISLEKLVDAYFLLLEKIQSCNRMKDINGLLFNCQLSLSLIEPFIKHAKKEYGFPSTTSIPAIEFGLKYNAVLGIKGQLENIQEVVEYFEELSPWRSDVEKAFEMYNLTKTIITFLNENEGFLQKDLKKALNYNDGRLVSNTLHYLERANRIKRITTGNTFSLYNLS
jgi:hypothetical protein